MPEQKFEQNTVRGRRITEITVDAGATSTWIPLDGEGGTVALFPLGTAKIQYTISRPLKIENNTARALDWSAGDVTVATGAKLDEQITAVRVVSSSGRATIEVQR